MKRILLANGRGEALVSDRDYELVKNYRWYLSTQGYACSSQRSGNRTLHIMMHRLVLGLQIGDDRWVDHKNHIPLDNRQCNLRICTEAQNSHNRRPDPNGASAYKGISPTANATRPWRAQIHLGETTYHIGVYATEKEAALAFDREATKRFGEYAYLNFPGSTAR